MKNCLVFGYTSNIISEFSKLYSDEYCLTDGLKGKSLFTKNTEEIVSDDLILKNNYFIFTSAILRSKKIESQSFNEISEGMWVNVLSIVILINRILLLNKFSNIVIFGSESGQKGSYDEVYFLSKAALEAFVREKKIGYKDQTINMISPSMIRDARMTASRDDTWRVDQVEKDHPKKRLLHSVEIAHAINWLFSENANYISNSVIQMNGGKFARMT